MKIDQILSDSDARTRLGRRYSQEIDAIRSARDELLQDTWRNALRNYEGKAPVRNFPWVNASNAVIPITATHTDAIFARLYNTATAQDPMFLISPWGTGEIQAGISIESFSQAFQSVSTWLETEEIPVKDTLEQTLLIMTKYGDSIVYLPWVHREVVDYDLDTETGVWTKQEGRVVQNSPVPRVIHPANFYIPLHETSPTAIQDAKFVAYDFEMGRSMIEERMRSGFYRKEEGDRLLSLLGPGDKPLSDTGDPTEFPTDDLKEEKRDLVGLDEMETQQLKMYHVWAREDIDGDGFEEEIQFEVHAFSGIMPHISYNPYRHRKRPFIHFKYSARDGCFYSIGVPEMLFNIQKILNQTMRDILDNNKVQNTKVFLVRKGSPVPPDTRIYPSRMIFVDNVESDFVPISLGSGQTITSINDIVMMQQWGERRTGISDFNLGQERAGRTPATTTLALLEEANKRIDLVVRRLRESLNEFWVQTIQLYGQFGFPDRVLQSLQGDFEGELMASVFENMSIDDIRNKVIVRAQASTQNLNRAIRKQEALAMFGQIQSLYEQLLGLANLLANAPDGAFRQLILTMAKGYQEVAKKIFLTFDEKDQANINPDLNGILTQVTTGGSPIVDERSQPEAGPGGQVDAALASIASLGESAGPTNPPGRPVGGLPRVPGQAPEAGGIS